MSNGNTPASSHVNSGKVSETSEKNGELNGKSIDKPVDEESKKGRFGWFDIEKVFLPMIFRYGTEKFTSVRMVERKLLNRFLQVLPPEVNNCTCIRSYYITDAESKLLNEINLKHTDCTFGKEAFTSKDLVVRLKDAKEFYKFLDLCHKKLVLKKSNASDRCGFFRINGESVVPYTMKEGIKYVPLFYFEGETEHLKLKSEKVDGWDLAYLKFCCKVQGIRNELFANDVCKVVALDEIKSHFPGGTTFEDYWPAKGSIEPVQSRHGVCAGNWTQKPSGQPKGGVGGGGQGVNSTAGLSSAVNINPAYRNLQPQQLTSQQLQQIQALQVLLNRFGVKVLMTTIAGSQPESDEHEQPPRPAAAEGGTDGAGESESEHGRGPDEAAGPELLPTGGSSTQQNLPGQADTDQGVPDREVKPTAL